MLFFTKKKFLVDLLEGLTDIHNHILPAIDDGAPDMATSLEMVRIFKDLGFKNCIATPHIMEDYYGNDTQGITDAIKAFKKTEPDFIISAASEYMMDGNFEMLLEKDDLLFITDRVLLTEFSYFQKPDSVNETIFNMIQKDIEPILAHPERYRYIKSLEEYEDLKNRGFNFQLNLLSLSGHYGKDALRKAKLLLENKLYDYIGTDAHKPEHLSKIKESQISKIQFDQLQPVIKSTLSLFN